MPAPYRYDIPQVDVGNYFDAFRQGRGDRLAMEAEGRERKLSEYLPGALEGDPAARKGALASGTSDQMIQLSQAFATADRGKLEAAKMKNEKTARAAMWANTPERWAVAMAQYKQENPGAPDIPFEQREMVIAQAQTLGEQIDQAFKRESLDLDAARTRAQNTASYASADASRASAEKDRLGPAGPGGKPMNDEQAKASGFANRLQSANAIINDFESSLTNKFAQMNAGVPVVGNYLVPESYQQADQATRDFINAQLRRESGAVISEEEFDNARKQYIPQPGDGPKVLAQKREARALAFRNMRTSAGPQSVATIEAPPSTSAPAGPPSVGQIINRNGANWRFLGGNPADAKRWRREP